MTFSHVNQAIKALESITLDPDIREEAIQFLSNLERSEDIQQLVEALQDDDFTVRWEAANILASMGMRAYQVLLENLVNPVKVGDPRLREGIRRVLTYNSDRKLTREAADVITALKGPAADLSAMREANHLLQYYHQVGWLKDMAKNLFHEE